MVAWTAPCLQRPILSRHDFQWPKFDGLPLVVSMQAPSPAPVGSLVPLQMSIYNLGPSPRHFDLTLPPALCLGSEHPYWVDDISFRPQHKTPSGQPTPPPATPDPVRQSPFSPPVAERIARQESAVVPPAGAVMIGNQRHASILSHSVMPAPSAVPGTTPLPLPEAAEDEGGAPAPRGNDGLLAMRNARSLSAIRPIHRRSYSLDSSGTLPTATAGTKAAPNPSQARYASLSHRQTPNARVLMATSVALWQRKAGLSRQQTARCLAFASR